MKRKAMLLSVAVIGAALFVSAAHSYAGDRANVAITVELVEGQVEWGDTSSGPWTQVVVGDVLTTCHYVRVTGQNSRVYWWRRDVGNPGCTNRGWTGSGGPPNYCRILHIGTEVENWPFPGRTGLDFGAIELVTTNGCGVCEVTYAEGPLCDGCDHCGFISEIAGAALNQMTPEGRVTTFSGVMRRDPARGDVLDVSFRVDPTSPIPLATIATVGDRAGEIVEIHPGQEITYFPDGSYEIFGDPIPTVSEWGLIVITLLGLTAGTIVIGRRRRAAAA